MLIKAGIMHAETLVVISPENQQKLEDESLYDSTNIFAVQNISKFFLYICTYLIYHQNKFHFQTVSTSENFFRIKKSFKHSIYEISCKRCKFLKLICNIK